MNRIDRICSDVINRYICNVIYEHKEDNLIDDAWDYANYKIDNIPVRYAISYVPSDEDATDKQKQNRELIWRFKNDNDDYSEQEYQRAKQRVYNYIKRVLADCFGEDVKKLCLVCVPCHSAEATQRRWKELSKDLCNELGMNNGFDNIKYNKDADHPSHWGGHTYPNVSFDKKFFEGQNVVLLDDLLTSGQTIRKTRDNLDEAGASVVLAITIAKTASDKG